MNKRYFDTCERIIKIRREIDREKLAVDRPGGPWDQLRECYREAAKDVAEFYGWKIAKRPFGMIVLAQNKVHMNRDEHARNFSTSFVDHPWFFRFPGGRAAAIVVHLYVERGEVSFRRISDKAAKMGVAASMPDIPSWYWPGMTQMVIYRSATEFENLAGRPFVHKKGLRHEA